MTTIDTTVQQPGEGLDFFSSLMSDIKAMNDEKMKVMTEALPNENKQVAGTQAANAEEFFEELQKEAQEVNECVKKFREKLVNHHG